MKRLICLMLSLLILMSVVTAYALSYDELLQKAEEYVASGDYEKAFACYDLAVKSDPENASAYIKACLLHLSRGEIADAKEYIEIALTIDATSPDGWLAKCRIDIAADDVAAFDSDALYAEICGANLSEYAADIGAMYAKAGYAEKAVSYFSQVSVDTLNDEQKGDYRRALISCGKKEKAVALGLDAVQTRNEKLDAAFDSSFPKLVETDSASIKLTASDFEISEEAKTALMESGVVGDEDIETTLAEALLEAEFVPLSKSPSGNSGIIGVGESAIAMYNGKYHIIYPSSKGVPDEYENFNRYFMYFNSRVRTLIGEEGITYSPDGRYAAITNKKYVLMNMQLFIDPILLDLSTGEMILTATYPSKMTEENAGAVTSTMFSSDNKFFYYILYGKFGDARTRLYRYNLVSSETEMCFESEKNLYYPHLAELEDGSILLLNDAYKNNEAEDLVIATNSNGKWSFKEEKLKADHRLFYVTRLMYSSNAGLACLLGNIPSYGAAAAFQMINPANNFEGIDKFWCIKKDTNEIVVLSPEEYQASIMDDAKEKEDATAFSLSVLYPYQTLINAAFSPDGNYLLLHTSSTSVEGRSRNLFLIRLEDMQIRKVSGLDAETIMVGAMGSKYAINIEWNTDELIIGTQDGIKTYEFAAED